MKRFICGTFFFIDELEDKKHEEEIIGGHEKKNKNKNESMFHKLYLFLSESFS